MGKARVQKHIKDEVHRTELLYFTLLKLDRYGVLPTLHAVFGPDKFLDFMEMFAGTTIVVPAAAELERAARDVTVYLRIKKAKDKTEAAKQLAVEYDLSEKRIWNIVDAMEAVTVGVRNWKQLDRVFLEDPRIL